MKKILVTGGAGFIGSHVCVTLLNANYEIIVLDNLINSSPESLTRIEQITKRKIYFIEGDIRQAATLNSIFEKCSIDVVLHLAGLKAVGESVLHPLRYYDVNIGGAVCLLQAMQRANVKNLIFSSSATVYGFPMNLPLLESSPRSACSPYGNSKLVIENMLEEIKLSDKEWRIVSLRYFNPVGAHESGIIGENPNNVPNNLMPYVAMVAAGQLPKLQIFGNDYPTLDGTGIRDYIHVMDLAEGHLAALYYLENHPDLMTFNLGTGRGHSVLEVVRQFEEVAQRPIPYEFASRRSGDVAECWADASLAEKVLGWKATRNLRQMCLDTWRWQCQKTTVNLICDQ